MTESNTTAPLIILLVEDAIGVRMSTAHYLRRVGFTVIEAGNAADAMDVIASGIHVDIVFSDIQMPGDMDGEQMARQLAQDDPGLPVILTSGNAEVSFDTSPGPPRIFFRKPYDLDAVVQQIIALIGAPEA